MVAPPRLRRVTVAEAVATYLSSVSAETLRGVLSPTTQRNYERDLREFSSLAGAETVLDDITGADIDDFLLRYQITPDGRYTDPRTKPDGPGRSAATVNRFRQSISRFFTHAARDGWVQADPMQWAAPPARLRGGLRVARTALSATAAQALLVTASTKPRPTDVPVETSGAARPRPDHDLALRDRLIIALLLILGPRVSEVARADVDDFVREPDQTRWRIKGKGGTVRTVSLSEPLARALDEYLATLRPSLLARRPGDADAARALLLTWRGRRIDAQAIRALLNRCVARMPEEYRRAATPHALRHTTATLLVAQGWDVKVIAELLGHASIATTGVYLDRIEGELAAAIRSHPLSTGLPAEMGSEGLPETDIGGENAATKP
ncbi:MULTISPECIES: tyrosine-type recombinase/integrase [Oerskovia]|uniref:Tyrosine-type recombinase/integrase n=2 Tax=Oerskovia TaxID=162491 RepID=A0ABR8V1Q9_9CELL|nr:MULTISPECIES: tyrosine-type recombinase/integrase [Oerskovia]MBD7998727.1 tyrosine-type recombinase/integrase [Oerskovia gallyi]MBM7497433.1 site-specific recombinase XerD [Oerskovia paurometabola]